MEVRRAEQLALASAEPSNLSLLGIVRHMADMERTWFRIRFRGEPVLTSVGPGASRALPARLPLCHHLPRPGGSRNDMIATTMLPWRHDCRNHVVTRRPPAWPPASAAGGFPPYDPFPGTPGGPKTGDPG